MFHSHCIHKHLKNFVFCLAICIGITCSILPCKVHAKAGANILLKNNCPYSVGFLFDNNSLSAINQVMNVNPYQTVQAGYFSESRQGVQVTHGGQIIGLLNFKLHSNLLENHLDTNNISGAISIDHERMKWNNLWYGTPSFTITACPTHINTKESDILSGIQRILIFGDSISDKGTLYRVSKGIIPKSPPYYDGVFSNGDSWAILLQNELKGQINVSNYSIGGATAVLHVGAYLPYSIKGEYEAYNANSHIKGFESGSQQLAFIFMGANDYATVSKNISESNMQKLTSDVIGNIQWLINNLVKKGLKKIVVVNLPMLNYTLESSQDLHNDKATARLTQLHNEKLKTLIENNKKLPQYRGEKFYYVDIGQVFTDLVTHTQKFDQTYHLQINKVKSSCWNGGYTANLKDTPSPAQSDIFNILSLLPDNADTRLSSAKKTSKTKPCSDPEHYLFWDRLHPTAQVHAALYSIIKKQLNVKTVYDLSRSPALKVEQ